MGCIHQDPGVAITFGNVFLPNGRLLRQAERLSSRTAQVLEKEAGCCNEELKFNTKAAKNSHFH